MCHAVFLHERGTRQGMARYLFWCAGNVLSALDRIASGHLGGCQPRRQVRPLPQHIREPCGCALVEARRAGGTRGQP